MDPTVVSWTALVEDAPELAAAVRARFEATKHHVLATLRADGSPRVSGTEVQFHGADLVAGGMGGSVKGRDLRRDGRFAIHSNPGDGTMEGGDAKVSGIAVEVTDAAERAAYVAELDPEGESSAFEDFELFRFGISEVVHTSLHPDGDRLVIRSWRPGRGLRRVERA